MATDKTTDETTPQPQPSPAGPSWARRLPLLVSVLVCAVAGIAIAALVVRGTWADSAPRDPSSSSEGVVDQLCRDASGTTYVRCSVILEAPADRVWTTIVSYKRFPEIFRDVSAFATLDVTAAEPEADGRTRLVGRVQSIAGTWPIDVRVAHTITSTGYTASWDEPSDDFDNRGSWTVTPLGPSRCLVVYQLDVRAHRYPAFLINAVLLNGAPPVLEAVRKDVERPAG